MKDNRHCAPQIVRWHELKYAGTLRVLIKPSIVPVPAPAHTSKGSRVAATTRVGRCSTCGLRRASSVGMGRAAPMCRVNVCEGHARDSVSGGFHSAIDHNT